MHEEQYMETLHWRAWSVSTHEEDLVHTILLMHLQQTGESNENSSATGYENRPLGANVLDRQLHAKDPRVDLFNVDLLVWISRMDPWHRSLA